MHPAEGRTRADSGVSLTTSLSGDKNLPEFSASVALPSHLHLLAKVYGVPESDLIHLAWALVLRSFLGTSSICWSTVNYQNHGTDRNTRAMKWECLELDEHHTISSVLQNWQDPSVHRILSTNQRSGESQNPATIMVVVKRHPFFDTLSPAGSQVSEAQERIHHSSEIDFDGVQ
ncbi:unnamed protein product [Penicillium salamii]|uniref:Uncharacterized protein n=1 Tax=Penicillium salamii TaxID=1612424 RepID=A0A9W4NAH8_9EURO|nr:unnamed protein product [Penicillium salamii]CAG8011525.1 unnamed protein product [Penicillium salamii]CAG8069047.1 unnamed protein product [Penicillium salamii]CAG8252811.1 unnamed protein product [Penicillium salamii]CAG8311570.1 unnamed protein product [Penicillium salamii]